MKLKISSIGNDSIQVQMEGEDYSIADIIHKELLENRHVKFAGVAPPHPLIKTLILQLHADGGNANDLLRQAITNAQERVQQILKAARKEFPETVRPLKDRLVQEERRDAATPPPSNSEGIVAPDKTAQQTHEVKAAA